MRNFQLFTPFMAFGGAAYDDYHELWRVYEIQIEEWRLYWSPNYVSITSKIVTPSAATTTPSITLASGSGSATSSGTTRSG